MDQFEFNEHLILDTKTYEKIFYKYYKPLFRYVSVITHNFESTKDVVQNVFLKLPKSIFNYNKSLGSFEGWLLGCAKKEAINYLRSETRINNHLIELKEDIEASYYEKTSVGYKIDDLTEILNEQEMEYIYLRYVFSIRPSEINKIMNLSEYEKKKMRSEVFTKVKDYLRGERI